MWSLYARGEEGVAIQSTIGRLLKSFAPAEQRVFVARVRYIDHARDEYSTGNVLSLAIHKNRAFRHEKELRAIVLGFPEEPERGVRVAIDAQ
jgi:hypothetical protein